MKYQLSPGRRQMLQSSQTKPRKFTVGALYAVGGMAAMKGGRNKLINWNYNFKERIYNQYPQNYEGVLKPYLNIGS